MGYSRDEVAALIDHTLLKPEASVAGVRDLVSEAKSLGAHSVCVSPSMLPLPDDIVLGRLKLAAVCGFPSGAHHSEVKAAEAARSVAEGADEVDMVVNLAWEATGRFDRVEEDIRAVREAVPGAVLKAIIESAALTDEQIAAACRAAASAGADFVKTSTGFHPAGGASVHAVALMRRTSATPSASRRPAASATGSSPWSFWRRAPRGSACPLRRESSTRSDPRLRGLRRRARSRSRGTPDLRPRTPRPCPVGGLCRSRSRRRSRPSQRPGRQVGGEEGRRALREGPVLEAFSPPV